MTLTPPDYEYVNTELPDGESVRFKRTWGGYRFSDDDVAALLNSEDIVIDTARTYGIRGSLDWLEYQGYEYYGFAPWAAEAYTRETAPVPKAWNGHVFTPADIVGYKRGEPVLVILTSSRTGSDYAVRTTFDLIGEGDNVRWGIIPHFDDFNRRADSFTAMDCTFMPVFSGTVFEHSTVMALRRGESVSFTGLSRSGRIYECVLSLQLDPAGHRWRMIPEFK